MLPLVNEDTRKLLERQIISLAHKHLGNHNQRLLLPPPPEKLSKGTFNLGTILYDTEKWSFALTEGELLQNLAIFGRSGAGKTNVVFHLLQQFLKKGIPFLFFDWKRTARHLLPLLKHPVLLYTPGRKLAPFPFNTLIPPPGLEQHLHVQQVLDILAAAYTLGDGATSLIQRVLQEWYTKNATPPMIHDLVQELQCLNVKGRAHGWHASAVRALQSLDYADLVTSTAEDQEARVDELLHHSTILELNGLGDNAKQFLIPSMLLWIFNARLARSDREQLRFVVIVEEAHHLLYTRKGQESAMERLVRQCRELGIAMVIVDQHPHLISSAALGNTFTTICLNLKDPRDMNRAAALCLLDEEDRGHLSTLPVGHGIVKLQNRWHQPFLVRFPLVQVEKGAVTNDRLHAFLIGKRPRSGRKPPLSLKEEGVRQVRFVDVIPSEDACRLIEDCVLHPFDGVKARYQRLSWSADKGTRLVRELVAAGLLELERVDLGTTRKTLLRPSRSARLALGLDHHPQHESIAHEFWKYHVAAQFLEAEYQVEIEAPRPRGGGRVDVLARKGEESVAIEVETGKSDVVGNVKADLAAGFTRVVVIATDDVARESIERQLGRAGLLMTERVIVADLDMVLRHPAIDYRRKP